MPANYDINIDELRELCYYYVVRQRILSQGCIMVSSNTFDQVVDTIADFISREFSFTPEQESAAWVMALALVVVVISVVMALLRLPNIVVFGTVLLAFAIGGVATIKYSLPGTPWQVAIGVMVIAATALGLIFRKVR